MTKEEAVGVALRTECMAIFGATWSYDNAWRFARIAIAAADKWDAEQRQPEISAGQDAAIQDELDHPPASIMEEGK
jgi:hypothetical protein